MRTRRVETALVTGAGSGMGRACALALASREIKVLAADLDLEAASDTAGRIADAGGWADFVRVDVSDSRSVDSLFASAGSKFGGLDLMVHAAAILGGTAELTELTDEDWQHLIAVNLDGTFYCCRRAVRWMKETGGGRILIFSSVAAMQPTPGAIGYSAAKGGVSMLGRSLAAEAAKYNIRVNIIAPGYIHTPMLNGLPEGFRDYILKKTPLKRLGDVDEVAALAAYLASDEADFFTGQIFSPNGGLVM